MNDSTVHFASEDLRTELARRESANRNGKCDACGDWHDAPSCGCSRHDAATLHGWIGRWRVDLNQHGVWLEVTRADGAYLSMSPRNGGVVQVLHDDETYDTRLPGSVTDDAMTAQEYAAWAIAWAEAELAKVECSACLPLQSC